MCSCSETWIDFNNQPSRQSIRLKIINRVNRYFSLSVVFCIQISLKKGDLHTVSSVSRSCMFYQVWEVNEFHNSVTLVSRIDNNKNIYHCEFFYIQ